VFQVLKQTGQVLQRIKPFPTIDPNIFVIGGITIDRFGVAYWNAVRTDPVTRQHTGFIIAAVPWGATKVVAYDGLIPDAPAATDLCFSDFSSSGTALPWPPPGQVPDQVVCGPQRPGLQVTPAIGADGTVFTATRADGQANYSYIVALHPDLTLKWATSLRGLVNDGCFLEAGLPLVGPDVFCPPGTPVGIDPLTGMAPAQQTEDASSGAPVVLPDGGVLFGAMRDYDDGRGILLKFDRHGRFAAHYDFGWDTTPAVYRHDGTYSVITKDNHYGDLVPLFGPFYMTQLSSELVPEWRFENTSTEMCSFDGSGTLVCTPNDPLSIGYEWCVNAPVVDRDGDVIATNEDGSLYVIGQGGTLKSKVFLNQALGSVYTPAAVDSRGRIFALNNGELSVFGGR
jgi:hypothetical protein